MIETKNYVEVHFQMNSIMVENESLIVTGYSIEDMINPPSNKDEINNIVWDKSLSFNSTSIGSVVFNNGSVLTFGEEKYNDWVLPFVNKWQEFKDNIEQEQQQQQQEYNRFENRQARALVQLNQDFETAAQRAHVKSSLGFEVDANSTANENVNGLLVTIGTGTVDFCDYYNQFHELNKSQLETLQSEIVQNGQNLYVQKWQYRTAIENCGNNEQLDAVLETIEFTYMDFTPQEDQGESQTE